MKNVFVSFEKLYNDFVFVGGNFMSRNEVFFYTFHIGHHGKYIKNVNKYKYQ
jgi:hypothetical protein